MGINHDESSISESCVVSHQEFVRKTPKSTDIISDASKIVQSCNQGGSTALDCKSVLKGDIL